MDDIDNILGNLEALSNEQNQLIQRQFELINRQQSAMAELRELIKDGLEDAFLAGRYPPPDLNSSGQEEEEDIPSSESDEEPPEAVASSRARASSRNSTEGASSTMTLTRVRRATRAVAATLEAVTSSGRAAAAPTTLPPVFHINDRVKFLRDATTAAGEGIVEGFTAENPPGLIIRRLNRKGGRSGQGKPGDTVHRGPFACELLSRPGG